VGKGPTSHHALGEGRVKAVQANDHHPLKVHFYLCPEEEVGRRLDGGERLFALPAAPSYFRSGRFSTMLA
jgi:hypothetical protein